MASGPPSHPRAEVISETDGGLDRASFRFWIRAASYVRAGRAGQCKSLLHCTTVRQCRAALVELAQEKSVNLPIKEPTHE